MYRRMSILFAALSLLMSTAVGTLAADNVVHYPMAFSEESTMPLDDAAACVGYAGTIYEKRSYDVMVTEFVDGPNQGMVHLTGVIVGEFTIAPEAGAVGPSTHRPKRTYSIMEAADVPLSPITGGTPSHARTQTADD